jgi:ABC-type cobalamin transport system permease subunit
MLWTLVVILVILWLLGFSFHIAGGIIHILLVIALVIGLIQLFTGRSVCAGAPAGDQSPAGPA